MLHFLARQIERLGNTWEVTRDELKKRPFGRPARPVSGVFVARRVAVFLRIATPYGTKPTGPLGFFNDRKFTLIVKFLYRLKFELQYS